MGKLFGNHPTSQRLRRNFGGQHKNSALNPNTEIRWVSFRRHLWPSFIVMAMQRIRQRQWVGEELVEAEGFSTPWVQLLEAHLVVGTERNVEEWLRNWMCTGGCFRKKTMVQNETWENCSTEHTWWKVSVPTKLQVDLKPGNSTTFESLGLWRTWVYIWTTLMPWRISQVQNSWPVVGGWVGLRYGSAAGTGAFWRAR